jgi:hypothetical protein
MFGNAMISSIQFPMQSQVLVGAFDTTPILEPRISFAIAVHSPRGSKKKPHHTTLRLDATALAILRWPVLARFWFWVEEQRSCAEDDRAEARSTMGFVVWRTLGEGHE